MKLAGADLIVWAIIAIVVAIAKGFGKFATPADEEPEPDDVAPPLPRPRSRPVTRNIPAPAGPIQIREMMERLAQPKRPVAPPPLVTPVDPAPKAPPAPKPAPVAAEAPRTNRSSQWATALRDRSNVRNIIIAAEIIGPPKGGG
ncbi:MAG: hypothetical protein WCS70_06110 [Verrucomicrobiota bacterium]